MSGRVRKRQEASGCIRIIMKGEEASQIVTGSITNCAWKHWEVSGIIRNGFEYSWWFLTPFDHSWRFLTGLTASTHFLMLLITCFSLFPFVYAQWHLVTLLDASWLLPTFLMLHDTSWYFLRIPDITKKIVFSQRLNMNCGIHVWSILEHPEKLILKIVFCT